MGTEGLEGQRGGGCAAAPCLAESSHAHSTSLAPIWVSLSRPPPTGYMGFSASAAPGCLPPPQPAPSRRHQESCHCLPPCRTTLNTSSFSFGLEHGEPVGMVCSAAVGEEEEGLHLQLGPARMYYNLEYFPYSCLFYFLNVTCASLSTWDFIKVCTLNFSLPLAHCSSAQGK